MKVSVASTFMKSLDTLKSHESWLYKTYSFFHWDLWAFLSNVWKFRKELYEHRWWDYHFTLQMLYRSISIMEKGMHNGYEVRESRDKKILKMQRLLELLDNNINDMYIELAEKELGYELVFNEMKFEEINETDEANGKLYQLIDTDTESEKQLNHAIYKKSREIEESQWSEIWDILKGQSSEELSGQPLDLVQEKNTKSDNSKKDWNDIFNGTGLRGWWD
jgi:hypothetical protein